MSCCVILPTRGTTNKRKIWKGSFTRRSVAQINLPRFDTLHELHERGITSGSSAVSKVPKALTANAIGKIRQPQANGLPPMVQNDDFRNGLKIYMYIYILYWYVMIYWLSWLNMTDILVSAVHTSCQPGLLWLPTPIRSTEHNKSRRLHSFPRSPKHTHNTVLYVSTFVILCIILRLSCHSYKYLESNLKHNGLQESARNASSASVQTLQTKH